MNETRQQHPHIFDAMTRVVCENCKATNPAPYTNGFWLVFECLSCGYQWSLRVLQRGEMPIQVKVIKESK
jgi:transposase-like protein